MIETIFLILIALLKTAFAVLIVLLALMFVGKVLDIICNFIVFIKETVNYYRTGEQKVFVNHGGLFTPKQNK